MEETLLLKFVRHFLENPYTEFYLRELAKKLKISVFATKKYSDYLVSQKIITERKETNLRYFKLNTNNIFVKHLKISLNIKKIVDSELIEHLQTKIPAITSIVLFGSTARGDDSGNSDIDIVIIGRTKNSYLNLDKFEKQIGRTINEHIFSWTDWKKQEKNNKAFYIDVISHGIVLYGEMPVV